jgi:hypothetical protein
MSFLLTLKDAALGTAIGLSEHSDVIEELLFLLECSHDLESIGLEQFLGINPVSG